MKKFKVQNLTRNCLLSFLKLKLRNLIILVFMNRNDSLVLTYLTGKYLQKLAKSYKYYLGTSFRKT